MGALHVFLPQRAAFPVLVEHEVRGVVVVLVQVVGDAALFRAGVGISFRSSSFTRSTLSALAWMFATMVSMVIGFTLWGLRFDNRDIAACQGRINGPPSEI